MFTLIKAQIASKYELDNCYTLDDALKLYALYKMDTDIEMCKAYELNERRDNQ